MDRQKGGWDVWLVGIRGINGWLVDEMDCLGEYEEISGWEED